MKVKYKTLVILCALIFIYGEINATFIPLKTKNPFHPFKLVGKWKLNFPSSELGDMPSEFAFNTIEIKEIKDSIVIIRYSKQIIDTGEPFLKQTFALNGQQSTYISKISKGTHTSSISWIENSNTMTLVTLMTYPKTPEQVYQKSYTETFELTSDGRSLTVIRNMKLSNEKLNWTTKSIYDII